MCYGPGQLWMVADQVSVVLSKLWVCLPVFMPSRQEVGKEDLHLEQSTLAWSYALTSVYYRGVEWLEFYVHFHVSSRWQYIHFHVSSRWHNTFTSTFRHDDTIRPLPRFVTMTQYIHFHVSSRCHNTSTSKFRHDDTIRLLPRFVTMT
jgi:hypothetical protein